MISRWSFFIVEIHQRHRFAPHHSHSLAAKQSPTTLVERSLQIHCVPVLRQRGMVKTGRKIDQPRFAELPAGLGSRGDVDAPALLGLTAEVKLSLRRQPGMHLVSR